MPDVYGVCGNNCRYLVFTREQVLALLEQAIADGSLKNIDFEAAAVTKVADINGGNDVVFWTGTEAEFNALDPAPTISRFIPRRGADGTIYICIDDTGMNNLPTEALTAEEIAAICHYGGLGNG